MMMISIFVYNNVQNNIYHCNHYIADHDAAAAAVAAAAADDDGGDYDDNDDDVDGNVAGDNVQFQMLSINMFYCPTSLPPPSYICLPSLSHACRCRSGRTPLHLSADRGHAEVAKLLVESKADLAAVDW